MSGPRRVGAGRTGRAAALAVVAAAGLVLAGCRGQSDPGGIADVARLTPENASTIPSAAAKLGDDVVALGEYCDRLGADDVARIVGLDASAYRWVDRECAYDLRGAGQHGRLYVAMTSSSDGVTEFDELKRFVADEVPVEGVGDGAVFRPPTTSLHVLDGSRSFFVQLVLDPPATSATARDELVRIADVLIGDR